MKFKKRLLTCLEFYWAKRLYVIYLAAFFTAYITDSLRLSAGFKESVLSLWFVPALASGIIARRFVRKVANEKEAALALMQFIAERPYFCTVAELTTRAIAIFAASIGAAAAASIWLKDSYVSIAIALTLFAVAYARLTGRELKKMVEEFQLAEKFREAHEEIKI